MAHGGRGEADKLLHSLDILQVERSRSWKGKAGKLLLPFDILRMKVAALDRRTGYKTINRSLFRYPPLQRWLSPSSPSGALMAMYYSRVHKPYT